GIIDQLTNVANREFQSQYLFGGRQTDSPPLNTRLGRVTFVGDRGDRRTLVNREFTLPFNVTVDSLLQLRRDVVGGTSNFVVELDPNVRLADLNGAGDRGVTPGPIRVTEGGPGITFDVNLSPAATLGDAIALFNDAAATAGSSITLGINPTDPTTLRLQAGPLSSIQVQDIGGNSTAADLGIRGTSSVGAPLIGSNVNRRITQTTPLSAIEPSGLSLPNGVTIKNGDLNATVDFAGAATIQDVLNRLNGTDVGIYAAINDHGDGIQIENLIAGTELIIGENGGTDAARLGIKTLNGETLLSALNGGRGVHPGTGDDFQITDSNGVSFGVDISGAATIQDVIDAINVAAGGAGSTLVADISPSGGGFRLTDLGGPNPISVDNLGNPVAQELGILGTGTTTELDGEIVGSFKQSGIFTALYRLRDALIADDSSEITEAGSDIQRIQKDVINILGQVGARSKDMQDRLLQTEDAVAATQALLSEVRDVDFVEAVTRFQQAQTALQASLQTGATSLNLSLFNFLG
ncbi:MAG: hypothetical protein KDA33_06165, partial [Phycisphaerales bacterium]|nr:hypothetical protein [Phycisphaerales bacterium]